MSLQTGFVPVRRTGLIVHGILIGVLIGLVGLGLWLLSTASAGPLFISYMLLTLAAAFPVPVVIYRVYALSRATYLLDRDIFHIRWGLRAESIPVSTIEWIRPASDLTIPLKYPLFSLPGALLGFRRHPDLHRVEYIASEKKTLLLIATAKHVYAVSPEQPGDFIRSFQRAIELGSLEKSKARSVYPPFVLVQAWKKSIVRFLWLSALFLNIGLFVWVSMLIPGLAQISLGYLPDGTPQPAIPGIQLMLIPIISATVFAVGWAAGLYFYRYAPQRPLAFILWGANVFSSLAFMASVLLIIL